MLVLILMAVISCLERFGGDALRCYSCVSPLPASTPTDAQHAFKSLLYSAYNLPPVHKWCAQADDAEFITIPDDVCASDDTSCMKISVHEQGLHFVMRGCQQDLYRKDVIVGRVECNDNKSPSICRCDESLCNSAESTQIASVIALIAAIFALFL